MARKWWHGFRLLKGGTMEQVPPMPEPKEPLGWLRHVSFGGMATLLGLFMPKSLLLIPFLLGGFESPSLGIPAAIQGPFVGAINVKAGPFGAKGDDVTDDFAALQAAFNAAASTTTNPATDATGARVYMPPGMYRTSQTLTTTRHMIVMGAGWGTVLRSATANPIIQMTADPADAEVRGALWTNFVIDGIATGNGLTGALLIKYVNNSPSYTARTAVVSQVRFTRCSLGAHCVNVQGMAFRDCKFDYNLSGLSLTDNSQIGTLDSCDFRQNSTVGLLMEASNTIITPSVADRIYSWTVKDCHFETNAGAGCILDGATYNVFINSKWEANVGTSTVFQNVNGNGYSNDGNCFIGGTWNGNPTAPTTLLMDMQQAKGTTFQNCQFNAGNTSGINIANGGWRTLFISGAVTCVVTDASAANVGTSWLTPQGSRVTLESSIVGLVDAATVAVDGSLGDRFTLLATAGVGATRAVGSPSRTKSGQRITITFTQDGVGGRALTWNAVFKQSWSDVGNTAGKRSTMSFIFDGVNWNQDGAQTPYV